jgi:hypothetical protein
MLDSCYSFDSANQWLCALGECKLKNQGLVIKINSIVKDGLSVVYVHCNGL